MDIIHYNHGSAEIRSRRVSGKQWTSGPVYYMWYKPEKLLLEFTVKSYILSTEFGVFTTKTSSLPSHVLK